MKRIALYGGSFDPIHNGHLAVARYMLQHTDIDELHFVLSPQNPLKAHRTLTSDSQRLQMLALAIEETKRLKICDIELSLPKPNYTINTLRAMQELHSDAQFSLVIGADNLAIFHQWKEHETILHNYRLLVYPRTGFESPITHPNIVYTQAPCVDVSSTIIRQCVQQQQSIQHLVPEAVAQYIAQEQLYK